MNKAVQEAARAKAYATPLDKFDMSDGALFQSDTVWPYFERMRKEDPVHLCRDSPHGAYWSITKYKDIMHVDSNHAIFSSHGAISIREPEAISASPGFIAMDPLRAPISAVTRKVNWLPDGIGLEDREIAAMSLAQHQFKVLYQADLSR